jgi:lysophospholipase L1-like esterase
MNRIALVVCVGLCALHVHADESIPCLYVIGDSTAASYVEERHPLTGWAQVLQDYLDDSKVLVVNKAESGRSSRSFYNEGRWDSIKTSLKDSDFVFIQFGHNDPKQDDRNRYTEPYGTYTKYLTRYVNDTRVAGAFPVLLTSINRNSWVNEKELGKSLGDYPDAVRVLAKKLKVPLIDMERRTRVLYERFGKVDVRDLFLYFDPGEHPNYPDGKSDGTHLSELGAREVCQAAVEGMRTLGPPLSTFVKVSARQRTGADRSSDSPSYTHMPYME